MEEFFGHVLRGAKSPAPVTYELTGSGWCEADGWPPKEACPTLLYAADAARASVGPEGGALLARAERSHRLVEWVHDPCDPVPSLVQNPWEWLSSRPDERDVEVRANVVTFSGEPLANDVDILGPVAVFAKVSCSARNCHLAAKLVVVDPSDRAFRLLDGVALVDTSEGGEAMIELGEIAYRAPSGHRLRLELAGSCYPRYAVHPGTNADPWAEADPRPSGARLASGCSCRSAHTDHSRLPTRALSLPAGTTSVGFLNSCSVRSDLLAALKRGHWAREGPSSAADDGPHTPVSSRDSLPTSCQQPPLFSPRPARS